ncbi:YopX family protein [Sporosarcina psychrophila]|uniref:Phage protein (TIGR01671 family) n=1 Tax=Sporosarcina psychrophila TaxID=1476 RepID=A0ABV2KB81_SPOPS
MRETKFRAWDNVEMKMYYTGEEDFIHFYFDRHGIVAEKFSDVDVSTPEGDTYISGESERLDHLIYQEYTGLKDKNQNPIYEGDIVDYEGLHKQVGVSGTLLIAKWNDQDACFTFGGIRTDFAVRYGEVVGNIHEHKHFLEGESIASTNK